MPGRTIVDRVAIGVVDIEKQTMRHLLFERHLQGIVVRVDCVLPVAHGPIVRICSSRVVRGVYEAAEMLVEIVSAASSAGQFPTRLPIDVFCTEQPVTSRSHVVYFQYEVGHELALEAKKIVIDVRVLYPLGQHDTRQFCYQRIAGIPAIDVTRCLRSDTLPRISGRAGKSRDRSAGRACGWCGAGSWAPNYPSDRAIGKVAYRIGPRPEGVEGRIPAGV